ncbi:MAG: right-handed parallel beta-helix repeat-containing protein, partial [Thermoanaerobaculia bacterium]
ISDTRIENNGASGIFIASPLSALLVSGSTISGHRDFGLALHNGRGLVRLENTTITDNRALDIDWYLDGPTVDRGDDIAAPAPRILSIEFGAGVTRVTVSVEGAKSGVVRLYTSDSVTPYNTAHLDQLVASKNVASSNGIVTIDVPLDLRGRYLSAVTESWTEQVAPDYPAPAMYAVSEVSQAVKVE